MRPGRVPRRTSADLMRVRPRGRIALPAPSASRSRRSLRAARTRAARPSRNGGGSSQITACMTVITDRRRTDVGRPASRKGARRRRRRRTAGRPGPPSICSGDMYGTVPTAAPSCVSGGAWYCRGSDGSGIHLASPKSRTLINPSSVSMTLEGLMSRWTIRAAWAFVSPSHIWIT
jgi:hypothetical protein